MIELIFGAFFCFLFVFMTVVSFAAAYPSATSNKIIDFIEKLGVKLAYILFKATPFLSALLSIVVIYWFFTLF